VSRLRVGVDIPYIADPGAVRAFVQAVEGLGYDHLGFSEHVCSTLDTEFPGPMFTFDEPWRESFTLAAFVAACTSRIEINPAMLLLPLYQPVLAAKQAAEVANLSEGRLRLAASITWNDRECEALGVDSATRGARFEEQVVMLRRLWTERAVDHSGRFFELRQTGISPRPAAPIPIWFGAGQMPKGAVPSAVAIDRAARLADGFKFAAPTFLDQAQLERSISALRAAVSAEGRDSAAFGIEVRMIVQATTPDDYRGAVTRAKALGATHLGVANRIAGGTVDDQIAVCRTFAELTRDQWDEPVG
jgi:probable F420-dependent oxidoreductase